MAIDMLPTPQDEAPQDCIRELTLAEVATLEHIFKSGGGGLPSPQTSTVVGAIRGGRIVAFLVLQLKLHAQPLWIEEGHSAIMSSLVATAEQVILSKAGPQWVYVFTPAGKLTQMAHTMGLQQEPWVVMSKLVLPDIPTKPVMDLQEEPQLTFEALLGEGTETAAGPDALCEGELNELRAD